MDAKKLVDTYSKYFEKIHTSFFSRRPFTMKRKNLIVKLGNNQEAISIEVKATFLINNKEKEKIEEIMRWIINCPNDR